MSFIDQLSLDDAVKAYDSFQEQRKKSIQQKITVTYTGLTDDSDAGRVEVEFVINGKVWFCSEFHNLEVARNTAQGQLDQYEVDDLVINYQGFHPSFEN